MKMMRRDGTSLKSMGTSGRSSSQYLHKKHNHTIIEHKNAPETENMTTTKKKNSLKSHKKNIIYSMHSIF